jgi:hypothetical protein
MGLGLRRVIIGDGVDLEAQCRLLLQPTTPQQDLEKIRLYCIDRTIEGPVTVR